MERFGGLDIVVANAGVGAYGPFLELDRAHLEEMIDINVKGTIYAVRAALPHLLQSDAADIVTVAIGGRSRAASRSRPSTAPRSSRRSGSRGRWTTSSARSGIRCTNVCPGGVATEFAMGRGRTPDMPALRGMMSAEDVAEVVLFVLTRPRNHRILEVAFRPVTEDSWG